MQNRRPRLPEGRWLALAAVLLLLPVIVLGLASRSSGTSATDHGGRHADGGAAAEDLDLESLGMEHVHGLGVDPAGGQLFAATHFGLFSVAQGQATRVGNAQDTMGFTITGPGTFLGSGHPDFSEDDEPLLGLIESTDAGRTWTPLSLRGEADFHTLRQAHGRVWGYDSTTGTLLSTTDRRTWTSLSRLPLRDFAISPARPGVLVATTQDGPVRSDDGGRSWQLLTGAPPLVVLSWPREDVLYGADVEGGVHVSADGGRTWTLQGQTGGAPEALAADDQEPSRVHVAVADVGIVTSADAGRTYTELYRQP